MEEKKPMKLSFNELPKPPSVPEGTSTLQPLQQPQTTSKAPKRANTNTFSSPSSNSNPNPLSSSPSSSSLLSTSGSSSSAMNRRSELNSFLLRESFTESSRLRQQQRPTRQSTTHALQRHHAFISVNFLPTQLKNNCGYCRTEIVSSNERIANPERLERSYFMCQRCTLSLHPDCVDKREPGVCEVYLLFLFY